MIFETILILPSILYFLHHQFGKRWLNSMLKLEKNTFDTWTTLIYAMWVIILADTSFDILFFRFFFAFYILTSKHLSHAQTSSSLFYFTPSNDLPRYFIDVWFGSLLLFSWVFYWCLNGHFIDIFPDISISVSPVFYWYSIWYSYWHFSRIFIGAFPGIF